MRSGFKGIVRRLLSVLLDGRPEMAAITAELATIATDLGRGTVAALPPALGFASLFILFAWTAPKRLALDGPGTAYWASSCLSTAHSFVIVPLAYRAFQTVRASDDLTYTTDASHTAINVFVGYILVDSVPLVWNRRAWSGTTIYLWHHGAAFLCWNLLGFRGHGHAVAAGLLLCEATAPFVNGRWFLSQLGWKEGLLYNVNGALMTVSFFALRIVWMGWLLLRYLVRLRVGFLALPASTIGVVFFGIVVGYPMQVLWFRKILAGLIKVLRGSRVRDERNQKQPPAVHEDEASKAPTRTEAFPVGQDDASAHLKKAR
jgi:hypothetical protein